MNIISTVARSILAEVASSSASIPAEITIDHRLGQYEFEEALELLDLQAA